MRPTLPRGHLLDGRLIASIDALGGRTIHLFERFTSPHPKVKRFTRRFTENPCAVAVVAGVSEFQERFSLLSIDVSRSHSSRIRSRIWRLSSASQVAH
jgi:hypothetical protein